MAKRLFHEKKNVIIHVFRFMSEDLDTIAFIDKLFKIGREYCERFEYNVIGEYIDETPYHPHRYPKYDEIRREFDDVKPLEIMNWGFRQDLGYLTYSSLADEIEMRKNHPLPQQVRRLF